jgi:hypothetical protein
MKKLSEVIEIKGLGFPVKATLIKRTKTKALYKRSDGYHEVFRIKVKPDRLVFGKSYPEEEVYPGNEDFGFSAWCCFNLENAERRYKNL